MKRILCSTLLATLAAAAHATPVAIDDAPQPMPFTHFAAAGDAQAQAEAWRRWGEDFARDMQSSMGTYFSDRMASGKVVKGAPYSAEVVTETNQPLADGNVISKRTSGRVYRDSEGRTRQESGSTGNASIFINDPVAGSHTILMPGSKRALVVAGSAAPRAESRSKQVVRVDGTEVRVEDGKVYVNGRETPDNKVTIKAKSGRELRVEDGRVFIDGKEVGAGEPVGRRVEVKREVIDGLPRDEVVVSVRRMSEEQTIPMPPIPPVPPAPGVAPVPPMPPMPPLPGIDTFHFQSTAGLGKGVTSSLGTRDFDGVKAEGKSTVWTIPAGRIGNRNAINVTKESWYSPELQAVVYTRHSDPRTGESIYRLASIQRTEPSPELFKVPEGYTVRSRDRHGAQAPTPPTPPTPPTQPTPPTPPARR